MKDFVLSRTLSVTGLEVFSRMDLTYFTSVRALTGGLGSNRKVLVKGGLALPKVEITGITCGCLTRRGIAHPDRSRVCSEPPAISNSSEGLQLTIWSMKM
ncbi:hypothetical protein CISIN_1g040412mg [Citrus sinensis]|uniref:Uncharacterized protein n=1 Tax=Citrus sinensis TaxID=2711 RepID=A0A067DA17_CITSI|nr:hypothetical protein CISIN_1g040412mg [Citrus sinensis]